MLIQFLIYNFPRERRFTALDPAATARPKGAEGHRVASKGFQGFHAGPTTGEGLDVSKAEHS
jgi:hypothetical protein